MNVSYSPTFLKMFQSLPDSLQDEVIEKIHLFENPIHHKRLKVHKLHGRLSGRYGFSVNYKIRIVFMYLSQSPREAFLLAVGDHAVYDQ